MVYLGPDGHGGGQRRPVQIDRLFLWRDIGVLDSSALDKGREARKLLAIATCLHIRTVGAPPGYRCSFSEADDPAGDTETVNRFEVASY